MITPQAQGCQNLLAALHEAGHAVVMAALGLPIARAKARRGAGVVILDTDKARILVARHKRQRHGPAPRFATVAAQLCVMAGYLAGGRAVALREATLTADNQAERAATIRMRKRHWGRTVGRA